MERLVIGIPARNEEATIADLAAALESGAAMLGEGIRCELVLAYQPGHDDTLARWESHPFRLPNRVLQGLTAMWARVATSNGSSATPAITAPTCSWWTAI